ncbi:HNH endonuclease family protein (plasmid) [Streptomyces sp. NBC_00637]|uniref:HNH endonuclease family protein n=1 Tax=Streptomyces sp. NBC_00637 TaxID=2903667 RepID=UPI002F9191E4
MRLRSATRALAATALVACVLGGCAPDSSGSHRTAAAAAGPAAAAGTAQHALDELPVRVAAPMTGYDRTGKFGPAWSDSTTAPGSHNSCRTRDDLLRRDLTGIRLKDGSRCVVASGVLNDPYTGKHIAFLRGPGTSTAVQIDHAVALGATWRTGAAALSQDQRENLGNDPLNLITTSGPVNAAKSDQDAAAWLPPRAAFRCTYVARQIAVKAKYDLWVTAAEKTSMTQVLTTCPDQALPTDTSPEVVVPQPQ